jgi:FAD/FMN-containing dehydrogenase
MTERKISRRGWLQAAGVVTVVAFDPLQRGWLSKAQASACSGAISIPHLDGEFVFDAASLTEGATDFGNIISRTPQAVLRPGSIEDIQRLIRFANCHNLSVAARGQAHSVYGQAQAECGVVIDSRALATIHSIDETGAWVDAGVEWSALIDASLAVGLTPRVLTDYIGLSVGGVLSVGGIGGATNRFGFVADNVEELEVVTGAGDLVRCHAGDLYNSVLGGLGQFGIIVRAKIALDPAPTFARIYDLSYTSRAAFLADQRRIAADERFDFLEGQVVAGPSGWTFLIQAGVWYTPTTPPNDAAKLAGLSPSSTATTDYPYAVWLQRVEFAEAALRGIGLWEGAPHPWSDIFLDDRTIETYLTDALADLAPADLGAGLALLYPFKRRNLRARFVKTPTSSLVWAFDLLRFPFPAPGMVDALMAQNQRLFNRARTLGGKRYPIGALPFSRSDWAGHYGTDWSPFQARKRRYDPRNVLTPGQGIFRR